MSVGQKRSPFGPSSVRSGISLIDTGNAAPAELGRLFGVVFYKHATPSGVRSTVVPFRRTQDVTDENRVPSGRLNHFATYALFSSVPTGLEQLFSIYPAINRWAINIRSALRTQIETDGAWPKKLGKMRSPVGTIGNSPPIYRWENATESRSKSRRDG